MHDPFHRFHYAMRSSGRPFSHSRPHWDWVFPEKKQDAKYRNMPAKPSSSSQFGQQELHSIIIPGPSQSTFFEQKLFDFPGSCQRARFGQFPFRSDQSSPPAGKLGLGQCRCLKWADGIIISFFSWKENGFCRQFGGVVKILRLEIFGISNYQC